MLQRAGLAGHGCFLFSFVLVFTPSLESVDSGQMVAFRGVRKLAACQAALLSTTGLVEF